MKRIFKYELKITNTQEVSLPIGAEILSAQYQGNQLCIWVMVNDAAEYKRPTVIRIYGTGHKIEETNLEYVATVQDPNYFVWHIFKQL